MTLFLTPILALLRPFLPYFIALAAVLVVIFGAYLKGKGAVQAEWDAAVHAQNLAALEKQVQTDAAVKSADAARADAAEAALLDFQKKAKANAQGLKHPGRECFDADDTRRVQRLFER